MTIVVDELAEAEFDPEAPRATAVTVPPVEADDRPQRAVRKATIDERFNVIGALVASVAITSLLFGWLTPLTG